MWPLKSNILMIIRATKSVEKVENLTQGDRIKNWEVKMMKYILHIVYIFMCNI